jgi:hypothetical protein
MKVEPNLKGGIPKHFSLSDHISDIKDENAATKVYRIMDIEFKVSFFILYVIYLFSVYD